MHWCRHRGREAAVVWLLAGIGSAQVPWPRFVFPRVSLEERNHLDLLEEALYGIQTKASRTRPTCMPGHWLKNHVYSGFPPEKLPAKPPWSQLVVMTPVKVSSFFLHFAFKFMPKFHWNLKSSHPVQGSPSLEGNQLCPCFLKSSLWVRSIYSNVVSTHLDNLLKRLMIAITLADSTSWSMATQALFECVVTTVRSLSSSTAYTNHLFWCHWPEDGQDKMTTVALGSWLSRSEMNEWNGWVLRLLFLRIVNL